MAAAVGLTVALAAFATYQFVHHQLYRQVESSLDSEWGVLATNGAVNPAQVGRFLGQYNNSLLQIIDQNGNADAPHRSIRDEPAAEYQPAGEQA